MTPDCQQDYQGERQGREGGMGGREGREGREEVRKCV